MKRPLLPALVFSIVAALGILTSGATRADNTAAANVLDDKDDAWTWSGATVVTNPAFIAKEAQALHKSSYGICVFTGTGAAVYGMTGPTIKIDGKNLRIGKIKIFLDGSLKGIISLASPDTDYSHKIYDVSGLTPGNHVLEVQAVEGQAVIDYLKPETDVSPEKGDGRDYFDTFKAGAPDWVHYGDNQGVINGQYIIQGLAGDKALQAKLSFRDLSYSCDVALNGGNDVGLIFRVTNPQIGQDAYNGYYVGLGYSRQEVVLGRVSGSWTLLASAPFPIQPNVAYTVKVIAVGPKITIFVNDRQVITSQDATFPEGGIGLRAYNSTGAFSNLHVTAM